MKKSKWWIEGLAVSAILLIVAVVFTWPLGFHLTQAIPTGSEPPAVSISHLALIEWAGKAWDGEGSYWNAPFFYPYQGAYAWWEPQPFTSVIIWFFAKLAGYIAAYNLIILIYLVGFGLVGYATARLLTEDRMAALWCGVWLTGGAYALQQICSTALIAVAFPLACLYFSFLFAKNKKKRSFWLAVLMYILTWGTCKQFAGFLTILLPFALFPFLSLKKVRWLTVINFILALTGVLMVVLPYSLRQLFLTQVMGFERALDNVKLVLKFKDLFMPAKGHWLITHILGWSEKKGFYSWDIGVMALLVIIASVALGILKFRSVDNYRKKMIIGLISMVIVALFLGFGLKAGIAVNGRNYGFYSFLYSAIPGLNFVRTPGRFGMFATFGIAVLAAAAFGFVKKRLKSKNTRLITSILLFIFLFAEMWTIPIALVFPYKEINDHRGAIEWLYEHGAGKPVIELPVSLGLRTADLILEAGAMLRMLRHGNPIVNGYTSFGPSAYKQLRRAMVTDPIGFGRRYLDAYGVRYAFVHKENLPGEQQSILRKALGENIVYDDTKDSIYFLPEKKHTQDVKQSLLVKANFNKRPREGRVYVLPLSKPIDETVLIMPQADWWMEFKWPGYGVKKETKKVRILGSVILDVTHKQIYFKILHFPQGNKEGEARVISPEEAREYFFDNMCYIK